MEQTEKIKKMAKIKFSHNYNKLSIQTECATLLQVFIAEKKELSQDFIDYDTFYLEGGIEYYPLPSGKLIILLFQDNDVDYLFTTVRRWTPQKEKYYRSLMGKILEVEVSADPGTFL